MLQPIQKEHELICPGCGVVLQIIEEPQPTQPKQQLSLNMTLLGSALDKSIKYSYQSTPMELYEEKVLRQLINLTVEFDLPERFAQETFTQLKRNRRGFRSQKEPLKQLIKILSKDENYIHFKKLLKLKARYENHSSF